MTRIFILVAAAGFAAGLLLPGNGALMVAGLVIAGVATVTLNWGGVR